jgi:folate-dependent tRNA-U54 methylase TrmFO/GidA
MSPYFPLEALRRIPGLSNARFEDPYAGGIGNSVRYIGMSPRDDALRVEGVDNLFCAGEKTGPLVGHTEAICTGTLAGFNAARRVAGKAPLVLPGETLLGDAITHIREQVRTPEGLGLKFTFSGSVLFERMKQMGRYTTDPSAVLAWVRRAGLDRIFA